MKQSSLSKSFSGCAKTIMKIHDADRQQHHGHAFLPPSPDADLSAK
jgi:hypothetical protein